MLTFAFELAAIGAVLSIAKAAAQTGYSALVNIAAVAFQPIERLAALASGETVGRSQRVGFRLDSLGDDGCIDN